MRLDARALFEHLAIPFHTGSKHSTSGWLQLRCPFPTCADGENDHLGYNTKSEYFNCWACGWHPLVETVALLANVSRHEAARAIELFRTGRPTPERGEEAHQERQHLSFPFGAGPLGKRHLKYLVNRRGFTLSRIRELTPKYNLLGTGPVGDYRHRIILPYTHYGRLVSYQSRDITGRMGNKYMACPGGDEIIPHKDCLFGADLVDGDRVVVVEGPLDALKLGPGAVATSGVNFTWAQVKQFADRWQKRYILFDNDAAGYNAARRLAATMSVLHGSTSIIRLPEGYKDPGDLPLDEALGYMKSLKIKGK